jgi:two-component system sensor histidine kinase QseC
MPWLVGRNLRPLETMAAQAGEMDVNSLKRRFPVATMPEELQPICTRLNDLLDRLQAAFERERRFSADVAHELRTPIAELRLLSEVALKFPQDTASATRSFEDSLDIAKQMEMIVGTLLEMIGSDGPIPADQLESVDIAAMALEAWRSLASQAAARQIQWKHTGPDAASVQTNGPIVRRIFLNLLGNAVEYAPPDSTIDYVCEICDQAVIVRISNAAPNLAQADLVHLTEPFWRKDPSRTGNRHSGLGLSLVSCYAQRLRVAMDFAHSQAGRFTVTLRFPKPASEGPQEARASGKLPTEANAKIMR